MLICLDVHLLGMLKNFASYSLLHSGGLAVSGHFWERFAVSFLFCVLFKVEKSKFSCKILFLHAVFVFLLI